MAPRAWSPPWRQQQRTLIDWDESAVQEFLLREGLDVAGGALVGLDGAALASMASPKKLALETGLSGDALMRLCAALAPHLPLPSSRGGEVWPAVEVSNGGWPREPPLREPYGERIPPREWVDEGVGAGGGHGWHDAWSDEWSDGSGVVAAPINDLPLPGAAASAGELHVRLAGVGDGGGSLGIVGGDFEACVSAELGAQRSRSRPLPKVESATLLRSEWQVLTFRVDERSAASSSLSLEMHVWAPGLGERSLGRASVRLSDVIGSPRWTLELKAPLGLVAQLVWRPDSGELPGYAGGGGWPLRGGGAVAGGAVVAGGGWRGAEVTGVAGVAPPPVAAPLLPTLRPFDGSRSPALALALASGEVTAGPSSTMPPPPSPASAHNRPGPGWGWGDTGGVHGGVGPMAMGVGSPHGASAAGSGWSANGPTTLAWGVNGWHEVPR